MLPYLQPDDYHGVLPLGIDLLPGGKSITSLLKGLRGKTIELVVWHGRPYRSGLYPLLGIYGALLPPNCRKLLMKLRIYPI